VTAKSEAEQGVARQLFMDKLEVDEEIAAILVTEGFKILIIPKDTSSSHGLP